MQRTGLIHISSMVAFSTPQKAAPPDHTEAPWNTHWSRTCEHDLVPRLKQYPSGLRAKKQCRKCGQGVGCNVPMAGVSEAWDEALEQQVKAEYELARKAYSDKLDLRFQQVRGEQSREWWSEYNRYLQSAVWQAKRELVMDRAGGVCECCLLAQAEHVHHLKYPSTFGMEPAWDLRAVCVSCHKTFHPHMED